MESYNEEQVLDWIAQLRGGDRSCPTCGHEGHQVFPMLQAAMALDPSTNRQGQSVPMLQVMCHRCGHMRFYAAQKLGNTGD